MNELKLAELEKRVALLEAEVVQLRAIVNGTVTNHPQPFSSGGPGDEEPPPKP